MKTDELIDVLSTNIEPADTGSVRRYLHGAIAAAAGIALLIALLALGLRLDVREPDAARFLALKLVFGASVVGLGSILLLRHARPGGEFRSSIGWTVLPFLVLVAFAGINLAFAPAAHWDHMIVGDQWLECLISIPVIAVLPFAVIMSVLRLAAPTNLARTGALAGLVAGGVSALGYALHCTDDFLPFVAVWYGGTIALCTLAGAILGPRLLRW